MKISLNSGLSEGQAQFAVQVEENAPHLLHLWDFNKREYKPAAVDKYFSICSRAEKIMAQFYLGLWRHDNHYSFDFIEAAKFLDDTQLKIIAEWLTRPVWP